MSPSAYSSPPKLIPGIEIRSLPIGPEEAFVLSRVDGHATVKEIGYATTFTEEQVVRCLRLLVALGAVECHDLDPDPVVDAAASKAEPTIADPSARLADPARGFAQAEQSLVGQGITSKSLDYDAAELEQFAEIERSRKQDILSLYYQLDTLDHYRLLGVVRTADRRAVKTAYYEKVKIFHPDRYFGKDLGPFRAKLERCFAQLTIAHDTLVAATSREEYDAYLDAQQQSEKLEHALSQTVTINDLDLLEQKLELALKVPPASGLLSATSAPHPDAVASHSSNSSVADIVDLSPPSQSVPKMSDDERKRLLARKLRASSASLRAPPRPSCPAPAPSAPPPPSREVIAEQLRRQLGGARREEQLKRLESQLAQADAAIAANDPVAASNALRIALSLAPNNTAIAKRLAQAQTAAAETLSDTYLRQAQYEEKSGRFDAAARSYERAARGKPSAPLWESVARCLLEAGGDLRAAGEFARQAISLDPERAASHLLLGKIFLAARMRSSAIAALERSRRLDPNNDTVLSLLKRIANNEI